MPFHFLTSAIGVLIITIIRKFDMTVIKVGTNKACAACKYRRRRCSQDCILSPYFPAENPSIFQNAHRLFGVCNIKRILSQVPPKQRDDCMTSIIFESNMRKRYPVEGCVAVAKHYEYQVLKALEELRYVKMQIALFKCQNYLSQQVPPKLPENCSVSSLEFASEMKLQPLLCGIPSDSKEFISSFNFNSLSICNGSEDSIDAMCFENEDNLMGKPCIAPGTMDDAVRNLLKEGELFNHEQDDLDLIVGYDDYSPIDAVANTRQFFSDGEETCDESSPESSFKDTEHTEHVSPNELKIATASFSDKSSCKGTEHFPRICQIEL